MTRYLSGRTRVTPQEQLRSDRYRYLYTDEVEPNLGSPLIGPSSIGAKPVPPGTQYFLVSVGGGSTDRYWVLNQGGIIPGSISVFDDGTLTPTGGLSSITQLNFVGAAISAKGYLNPDSSPGVAVTITVFAPGNNQELLFNSSNEFGTSSKLTFDSSTGLLSAGDKIFVGAGGTVITTTSDGLVGLGTTNPTQELHIQGDLRLTGTIYDSSNQPGTNSQVLVKNNFGGVNWSNAGTIKAGAGGTYQNIQFHNNAGLVDGAPNFVFDEINSRVGIGSTQPRVLLDVIGVSSFRGGTTIDNLTVSGVTTTSTLGVSGTTTTRNLLVTGITTIGFVTGTSAYFTGIVTASKFSGAVDVTNLYVTGVSTFTQKVNINSDLGVTGLTTTRNLQVYQSTTLNTLNASGIATFSSQVNVNNLNVTGVGTFDNIKLDTNTISTLTGNLILDSSLGTTEIDDDVYIQGITESSDKDTGALIVEGGVGIEKRLNVGGQVNLATSGGITTTGGDLYVGGDLFVKDDIFYDELFARNGFFTGIVSTKDLTVSGVATVATLGVSGLTTTKNLRVVGVSTLAGAYIDNIQIGITADNQIDTSTGNLIIDSAGGTTTINDALIISGITSISNTTDSSTKDNGALIVDGGVGIEKNLNVGGNTTLGDANTDTVTFNARVNSNLLPSTDNTYDLGSPSLRWNDFYVNNIVGNITGAASSLTVTTDGANSDRYLVLSSATSGITSALVDSGIVYNPSTNNFGINVSNPTTTLTVAGSGTSTTQLNVSGLSTFAGITTVTGVNLFSKQLNISGVSTFGGNVLPFTNGTLDLGGSSNKWNNVYANTFVGAITGNADTATRLATARNIDIDGDVIGVGIGTTFDGSRNVTITTILSNTGVIAGTYGSSTQVGILTVDAKGRITAASNVGISFTTATVAQSDKVATISNATNAPFYPTFVDSNNGTAAYESVYTDAGITYNPNTELLSLTNLIVTGITTLGNANTDKVSFAATVDSNIIPSGTTRDLGSAVNKWNNVYANTFVGAITGNADTATKLATARNIDIDGDVIGVGIGTAFDGSQNVTIQTGLSTTGVTAGTYGSSTTVGIMTVDAKGRVTAASNVAINFSAATVSQADKVATISNTTDSSFYPTFVDFNNATAAYESVYTDAGIVYNPSSNLLTATNLRVTGITTLGDATSDTVNFTSRINSDFIPSADNTYDLGSASLRWNQLYVNTLVGNVTGAASSLSVTTDGSSSARYLVLSSATSGITSALVDSNITYNPSSNLLTVPNIRPTSIQDSGGGTGTNNYVLTANGSGGWTWKSVTGSGGAGAIGGITIQEEGAIVGTQLGITTINFIGAAVTATSPATGVANISISGGSAANVTVTQTGYGCANPITVTSGSNIGIGSTSNAYGRRYIQSTAPASACDGDIWYDTSSSSAAAYVPTGSVFYFAASTAPTGYLECNGASLSTTTYAILFAAIGYTFGGSGASFSLPDLRGEFIRGWDNGRNVDTGRTFGSSQTDDYKSHTHQLTDDTGTFLTGNFTSGNTVRATTSTTKTTTASPTSGGTETRPRNIALLACIKY